MATEKYPHQNVNMPMDPRRVAAMRNRDVVAGVSPPIIVVTGSGNGSLRQIGNGEWIDDRVIDHGYFGPVEPSAGDDRRPELPSRRDVPASYDPTKVYEIKLKAPVQFAGRWLDPTMEILMQGADCTGIADSIIDAVEVGDIPVYPDTAPSD